LIPSVDPEVKIISFSLLAPKKFFILPRTASNFSVAKFERKCNPRCTLAYSYSYPFLTASITILGFCADAPLSR
jgi:hypothetical protein